MQTRILFVDDEPSLRLTLPAILEQHGFNVSAAATVADALKAINSQQFDALIADLNVGEPGDGFTVVSAMRRTQPHCVNFILTGYPAFETALQAIRSQVDDYLIKPADIDTLVESIRSKLGRPKMVQSFQPQPLATFLLEHADEVVTRALNGMKSHPRLSSLPLSDKDRIDHIPAVIEEIIHQLQSNRPNEPTGGAVEAGAIHGERRAQQGYSQLMLVDDTRVLDSAFYDVVQDNLLKIELSNLIPDLSRLNDTLEAHLQAALQTFIKKDAA